MIKSLTGLDPKLADEITAEFDKAVAAKINENMKELSSFGNSLKESYKRKLNSIKNRLVLESRLKQAKLESQYRNGIAKIKQQTIEANKRSEQTMKTLYESKFHSAFSKLTKQVLKENEVPMLQAEDSEKVLKLLALFEEMLSVFGVSIKEALDITDNKDGEIKDEIIEEAKKLKSSYKVIYKENIILESALRNNVSDIDEFKKIMSDVKFTNTEDFAENCDIMAKKFTNNNNSFSNSLLKKESKEVNSETADKPLYLSYKSYF